MSRVVRSSKFRHVFGTAYKQEDCFNNLQVTRTAWDSNLVCASPLYFGVIWLSQGGGSFAVIPHSNPGKFDAKPPLVTGHKGEVLDIDFCPFNDSLIASVSEDCTAKIWGIPDGGLKENLTEPLQTLSGHKRKVGTALFNPVANNILATSSTDYAIKIWEIEKGTATISLDGKHTDIIQSVDWNSNGSLLASSCKDKKLRIVDPRAGSVVSEAESHQGVKGSRVIWVGSYLFSSGFTKTSEREIALWDPKSMDKPLMKQSVDTSSGLLMPYFDRDLNILFLAGKGDGNIRYYEVVDEAPYIHFLSEFKSNKPQRGGCFLPKRAVSVSDCEIVRFLKVETNMVTPISFQVPRKSDLFQDDIFPDCFSGEPSLSAADWLSGNNAQQKTRSMAPGFVQKEKKVEFNPEKKVEEKPLSEKELKELVDKLQKRVAYLEAELVKRDAKIKELNG